jgi:SPP1 family phage portal protein
MELEQLNNLLADPKKLKEQIVAEKPAVDSSGMAKTFYIDNHEVNNIAIRKNKTVNKTSPTEKDAEGNPKVFQDSVEVARLPIPFQKRIVDAAAAFLCGNPIDLVANPANATETALFEAVKQTWEDNKLDYESKKLAKLMMAETEVAELWYPEVLSEEKEKIKDKRFKMKIILSCGGTALYPVFDKYEDMIAFGRLYKLKEVIQEGQQAQEVEYFEVFTAEKSYYYKNTAGQWAVDPNRAPTDNPIGKIPVIYYHQDEVEWADVQPLIARLETLISNHADTNDYFGSPIVKFKGNVQGVGDKYEQGKAFQLDGEGADASYMTWDQSPASLELEYKNLRSLIMDFTSTPDLSIEQMKSLGTYSGIALKMLFMAAHLKASDKEENFGKSIQRRINLLKAAHCKANTGLASAINMTIKPKFEYYLPKNEQETIAILTSAKNNGLMSQESAVMQNPLVEDADAEWDKIQQEQAEKDKKDMEKMKQQGNPVNL